MIVYFIESVVSWEDAVLRVTKVKVQCICMLYPCGFVCPVDVWCSELLRTILTTR